jgi:hypothetical protein
MVPRIGSTVTDGKNPTHSQLNPVDGVRKRLHIRPTIRDEAKILAGPVETANRGLGCFASWTRVATFYPSARTVLAVLPTKCDCQTSNVVWKRGRSKRSKSPKVGILWDRPLLGVCDIVHVRHDPVCPIGDSVEDQRTQRKTYSIFGIRTQSHFSRPGSHIRYCKSKPSDEQCDITIVWCDEVL